MIIFSCAGQRPENLGKGLIKAALVYPNTYKAFYWLSIIFNKISFDTLSIMV